MKDKITREDFETAVLRGLLDINETLKIMVEFQERLGEAIEMLAQEMGYEFNIKEDAKA